MDRFSLPRLPTVALIEVLQCFNPIELYHLSQCSQKMAKLIPLAGTKQISLSIDFDYLKIVMNKNYVFQFRNRLSNVKNEPNTFVFDFLDASDTEIVDQMRVSGYFISTLFKCPIKGLRFGRIVSMMPSRSIIEEVLFKQDGSLENLTLYRTFKKEDLKWILEKANITGRLEIWKVKLQHFPIDLKLNCRHFLLDHASWFTVDNLVSLTSCVTIGLFETKLTHQDLDFFMRTWKSGLFPNLEHLRVFSISLMNDGNILGFSKEQLSAKNGVRKELIVDNDCYGTCDRGVDVTNNDGIRGSIQMFYYYFELFVWKD